MRRNQAGIRTDAGRFRKGHSGNLAGRPPAQPDTPRHAPFASLVEQFDAWQNTTTGLGIAGRDKTIGTTFEVDVVSSEDALAMWRGDAIASRLVEVPVNEALRQGFDICVGDDEMPEPYEPEEPATNMTGPSSPTGKPTTPPGKQPKKDRRRDAWRAFAQKHPSAFDRRVRVARRLAHQRMDAADAKPLQEAVSKTLERIQATAMIREAMHYERAYGGGALLIGANDFATDLRKPLDLARVRSLDYLTPIEPRELMPQFYYNDPRAPKFGQAAIYQLVPYTIGASVDPTYFPRIAQIHESRLIIFPGNRVSRRVVSSTGMYGWGDSVFTRVIRALRAFNVGHQNVEVMLSDFAQAVYKIKGLADLIARNPNALIDSMVSVDIGRSICRAIVIDAEEDFERKSTSLSGYADTLHTLDEYLAACGDMPLTLLLGVSPAGLNATGESDIRLFYDREASVQQTKVAPALMRIIEVALAAMGENPEEINHSIRFKALWQPTEKEIADAHLVQAQADAVYIDRDVVSPEEIALSRFGGDQFSYETHVDFDARASQLAAVAPTVAAKPEPPPPPSMLPPGQSPQQPPTK